MYSLDQELVDTTSEANVTTHVEVEMHHKDVTMVTLVGLIVEALQGHNF